MVARAESMLADACAGLSPDEVGAKLRGAASTKVTLEIVRGDDDRIRQAVANLLSNACKHTHTGSVELSVVQGDEPGSVRIEVLDTGSGIDLPLASSDAPAPSLPDSMPAAMSVTVERSYFARFGCVSISKLISGTPTK